MNRKQQQQQISTHVMCAPLCSSVPIDNHWHIDATRTACKMVLNGMIYSTMCFGEHGLLLFQVSIYQYDPKWYTFSPFSHGLSRSAAGVLVANSLPLLTFPVDLPRISACAFVIFFPLCYILNWVNCVWPFINALQWFSKAKKLIFVLLDLKQKNEMKWNGIKNVYLLSMKLATTKI